MRSKFSERRRQRILAVLAAGGSRRTAAAVGGIDHHTLARWLKRGQQSTPRSRWRRFYEDVQEAESGRRLVALPDDDEDEVVWAMRYLESHDWFPDQVSSQVIELHLPKEDE